MDDFLKQWQWRCGVAALLASLFFTGAWVKSAVDQLTGGRRPLNHPDAPSPVGNIVFSGSYDVSPPRQVNWTVSGLYSTARMTFEPDEASPSTADSVSVDAQFGKDAITSASHLDLAGSATNFVTQTTATVEVEKVDGALPLPQGSFQVDPPGADLLVDSVDSFDAEDSGEITFDWRLWGLQFVQESHEGRSDTGIVIPHWMVALPCAIAGVALVFCTYRGRKKCDVVSSATTARQSPGITSGGEFFHGWRPKVGSVTLLVSLALVGGWIRSFVVADLLNYELNDDQEIRFASGKEGVVFQSYLRGGNQGSGTYYRARTGAAYEKFTFRPNWDLELQQLEELMTAPATPPIGATSSSGPQLALYGSESLPSGQLSPPVSPSHPFGSVSLPSGELLSPLPPPDAAQTYGTVSLPPNGSSAFGSSYEWAGLYAWLAPSQTTIVIPYGYLVIPLTLLSAGLLLKRRALIAPECADRPD